MLPALKEECIVWLHPQSTHQSVWQLSARASQTGRYSYPSYMIAAATSVDDTSTPHQSDSRNTPTYAHTTSRTKPDLWRQPSLANVTCAWGWRLCGINPATAFSYLTTMILPYDHPTYSLVLRFSLRSQSSRGRKYSLMWLPFSLVSPVAKYSASVHGTDDPSLIMSLQRNIQTFTQSVVQKLLLLQHSSAHKASTCLHVCIVHQ